MNKLLLTSVGLLFSFYSATAQKDINQFDSNKKRHGIWKKTYTQSNQLRYEGTFDHGKEIGTFKFYCETCGNQPEVIKEFDAETGKAWVQFFSRNGKLLSEGAMKSRYRVDEWNYYAEDSDAIIMRENYKDGKLHGTKVTYYPDGNITEKLEYINGKQEGESIYLSPNGKLLKKLYYSNNLLNGPAEYYDNYGNMTMKGTYRDGNKFGVWTYYKNGNVLFEKTYN